MPYTWFQDNTSITVNVQVPAATLPTDLKLILSKRRLTLLHAADRSIFLRRRTYAAIEPRCTDCYTMPVTVSKPEAGYATVRVVLYKAVPAGWLCLFAGDSPKQGFINHPAPMSHALIRLAAQAKARAAAADDARRAFEGAFNTSHTGLSKQSWRALGKMEGPLIKKAGGRVVHSKVSGAITSAGALQCSDSEVLNPGGAVHQTWRPAKRWTPYVPSAPLAPPPALPAAGVPGGGSAESGGGDERATRAASMTPHSTGDGWESSSDCSDDSSDDSSDDDPDGPAPYDANDEAEYPLPGSEASCDQCGKCVHKYWHCVQCGTL